MANDLDIVVPRDMGMLEIAKHYDIPVDISIIKNESTRITAYIEYGYTKEAFNDPSIHIRFGAYRELGFTREALNDSSSDIRRDAAKYFKLRDMGKDEAEKKIAMWKLEQI